MLPLRLGKRQGKLTLRSDDSCAGVCVLLVFGWLANVMCVEVAASTSDGDLPDGGTECARKTEEHPSGNHTPNNVKFSDVCLVTPDNRRLDSSISSRWRTPGNGDLFSPRRIRSTSSISPKDESISDLSDMKDVLARQLVFMENDDARTDDKVRHDVICDEWKQLAFIMDRFFLAVSLVLCLVASVAAMLILYFHDY